jgi:two-component system, cell cycle sensor histidine kinase and response regulator CckA
MRQQEAIISDEMLRKAALVLTKTGDDFVPAVVAEMASVFSADVALVAEFTSTDHMRTVAICREGSLTTRDDSPRCGTPLERLEPHDTICHRAGAQRLFPADPLLASVPAEGYLAVPLVGGKGEIIGVMAVLTRRPLPTDLPGTSFLHLIAGRVAAELERASTQRELQKNERYLKQVQRVEAIGWLAGNIAHDFNNLLMIVIGYGEILQDRAQAQELSELLTAARRASTLTKQLLAFGRRQVMQVQRVDLNRVVAQVQPMLTRVMSAQVRVITSLDPELPSVEVDPGQLEQVVVNLAINARDAMPEGGTLHIDTAVVDVAHAHFQMGPGRYVRLCVRDSGIGMPPEVLAQIFEPFFTTKGSRGTGLGLSSVYGIVKQSGGFIWCDSTPGAGTTFSIYLRPIAGTADSDLPAPATERARGGEERILVVDDEPAVRKLLARILRARGYDVFETEDGPSALAFMSGTDRQMDLVVTDVLMPKMSGTQLAKEIQTRWPSIKILLVSGYPRGERDRPTAIDATLPMLGKPFTPTNIENAVRELLDSRR